MDITAAAIATIISSLVATCVAIFLSKRNDKKSLNDQLDNILKIAIQYPYLESTNFTKTWEVNRESQDEKYLRYDCYCVLVFNFMERFGKYYNFNEEKINNDLNLKEWVRIHKWYWLHPTTPFENVDGYQKKFRLLINSYLK